MNNSFIFLCAVQLIVLLCGCGDGSKTAVVYDKDCNYAEVLVEKVLHRDRSITICQNGAESFYKYTGYVNACGEFKVGVFHLKDITVGEFQYNIVKFNTDVLLDIAAEKIMEQYTVEFR